MPFKVLLHKRAAKSLEELDVRFKELATRSLMMLETFPNMRLDVVKIAGEKDTYRVRVRKFRALFKVYGHDGILVVAKIDVRRRAYRKT